jgi:hypothetical protein
VDARSRRLIGSIVLDVEGRHAIEDAAALARKRVFSNGKRTCEGRSCERAHRVVAHYRRRRSGLAAAVLVATVALLAVPGCLRVKPHQREDLARRSMDPAGDPAERKLDGHVEEYREGSIGGGGAGGGGCGCN